MAVQYRHEFTVVSKGIGFPLDMLRYDRCTPKTEQDANALARTIGSYGVEPEANVKVRMVHVGERAWQPTFRRWATYGCAIVCSFGGASTDGTARGMVVMPSGVAFAVSDYPETRKAS